MSRALGVILVLHAFVPAVTLAQDSAASDTVAGSQDARDREAGPYFYKGLSYGSDAYMGPLDVILNKGFALSQTDADNRKIFDYPYGVRGVGHALAHPVAAIERGGGWWQFISTEILPLSYSLEANKWYTNYVGHVIEGGIHMRRLAEWYEAHGVPLPGLLASATSTAAAFLNEFYEQPGSVLGSAGTVADLYVFDLAGILLFSWDEGARFFAQNLHANVWTGQASIALPSGEVENNANYLHFKLPLPVISNTSLFFWTGIGAQMGATFHRPNGLDVSVAVGNDAKRMSVDPITGVESATLALSAGLFVDRNGSLLASAHVSKIQHRVVKLNVDPGVIPALGGFGAWLVMNKDREFRIGISNRYWLGAGVGWGH